MTPKLFIASGIFHPESGGPATYLHELLPRLQARGWQVRLLTYGDATATVRYPYAVQRVPRRAYPLRMGGYALAALQNLRWADVVYAHTIDLPLLPVGAAPRIIKIVGDQAWERCMRKGWIAPDADIDAFQHEAHSALVAGQQRSRSRQVQAMQGVIVPSQYLRCMVQGWGVPDERIHVIYNALPALPDDLPTSQVAARAALALDAGPTVFTAARLERWKGVDHLIRALAQVPDVRLLVAGDGAELPRLQALAAELKLLDAGRVQFLGRLPRRDVYTYMLAADYFALYSGYEGLPHTLLECLQIGTPVIASDKGGNPEVVQHDVNGLLVPYVDVDTLAQTLRDALTGDTRSRLAAGTANGLERFDFGAMVRQTHDVLSSYLN